MTHKIGIIGTGNISAAYLRVARELGLFEVRAVTDLDLDLARARAVEYGTQAAPRDELLADPEITAVVNLTPPAAHAEVSMEVLRAGKHVYSEKPLAIEREDGLAILREATGRGLRVGCAPDTFLGAGFQTARELLDAGAIGRPVAATAFMMGSGPESWHPNPAFFFQRGAGPLFDMGPYYLTALVHLLGPVQRVSGSGIRALEERVAGHESRRGERISVNTPTHVTAQLTFEGGQAATFISSFDAHASELPRMELYGTEGTLSLPDPNTFGGPVRLRRRGAEEWETVELKRPFQTNARGIGLADMLSAIAHGTSHRASGDLAFHILDIMHTTLEASAVERTLTLSSSVQRPEALETQPAWFTHPGSVPPDQIC
ncbi:Gfo/Idh/MocA family protein [Deinococcus hopiensis]|uniref:Predicted dehydrogenase n=1 Tax=Deinococcus hopiensis KR-140 TaxID=695939 RepID=A0A1W1UUK0_9DEIO|nr:Gfo/Idh/MocA family oxidoreductase [Deinococcus hopiensis]SMB84384.1 Predicted dehydrogenase [Deinococcus hopiensis KR-140]